MDNYEVNVYKKMSAEKKVRLASQLYLLGRKLQSLNVRRIYVTERIQKNAAEQSALDIFQEITRK